MSLTVAQLVARLSADTSGFYKSMAIANSSMIRTGGIVSRVSAGAGLAVLGMGFLALRTAANYETAMNLIEAVMEPTEAQMKALSDEAVRLGADLKLPNVSAKDAADAMLELGKGGLSVNQVLEATRGTLQLGLAANIGFADSARIVARTLKAFSLEGDQATTIANLLAAGANKSTAEMDDLALGIQNAASQFFGAGMSIQDLVVSLSIMTDHAVSGELAGTALKTMLVRLQGPTQKAADLMAELGIDVFDAKGNMIPMPGIIQEFQKALGNLTQEQRENVLVTLFGTRANSAMRILLSEGKKGWNEYSDAIIGNNAAQKIAEARTKGFNGQVQNLFSSVETLAIELGTHMLPTATRAAEAMAKFVRDLDSAKIVDFFGALADGVATIWNFATGNDAAFASIVALTAGFVAYRAAMAGAAAATAIFNVILALTNGTLVLTRALLFSMGVGALIAIAAGLVMAYQRSETFRAIVHGALHAVAVAFEFLMDVVMTVVNFIRDHWKLLVAIITGPLGIVAMLVWKYWDQIKSTTMSIFEAIKGFFAKWWPLLFVIFAFPLALIFAVVNRTWRRVFNITMAVFNAIKGFVSGAWSFISGITRSVLGPVVGVIRSIWNTAKSAVITVLTTLGTAIWNRFDGYVTGLKNMVTTFFSAAWDLGKAIFDGILNGIGDLLGALKDKIVGAAEGALDTAKGFLGIGSPSKMYAKELGAPLAEGVLAGFKDAIRALPQQVALSLVPTPGMLPSPPAFLPASVPAMTAGGAGPTVIHEHHYHGPVMQDREFLRYLRTLEAGYERSN